MCSNKRGLIDQERKNYEILPSQRARASLLDHEVGLEDLFRASGMISFLERMKQMYKYTYIE